MASMSGNFKCICLLLTVITVTLYTRLYKIGEPEHVCWDETHFGKMASFYINRTFFFDVHPPLGKMLISLAGAVTGYNGTFLFEKPGDKYEATKYVGMRIFSALCGSVVVILAFLTSWKWYHSLLAASVSAIMMIFDTGLLTLSQYILLDPILLFFISLTIYSYVQFKSQEPFFCFGWWFWLAMTGISLSAACSIKWVGLFSVLFIGLLTISDLWQLLGDLTLSMKEFGKHFVARAMLLILLPIFLYLVTFAIHFYQLSYSGSGDAFFSSSFQSGLIGNSLYQATMPKYIAYDSIVTIRNKRTAGGLLHSHGHLYPEEIGPAQQQVTAYTHKDDNNKWLIKKIDTDSPYRLIEYVKSGDLIRLEHVMTRRNLHSHLEPAPLTKRHQQVSCYGENGTGDLNDIWKLDVVGTAEGGRVMTVKSTLRLIHLVTDCALHSHSKTLPKWGWEQLEVTCNSHKRHKNNLWNIEDHINDRLPNDSFQLFKPSFMEKFTEAHAVMAQSNNGLKPKKGELTSQPWQWPLNYKGQRFSGVNESDYRVYLLGNPVIWWTNDAALAIYILTALVFILKMKRKSLLPSKKVEDADKEEIELLSSCGWMFLGWLMHYLPFFMMGRVLYFHHYFPAMFFNCLLTAGLIEYGIKKLETVMTSWTIYFTVTTLFSIFIYSFYLFSPLSYGMTGPYAEDANSSMSGLKWLESWEI